MTVLREYYDAGGTRNFWARVSVDRTPMFFLFPQNCTSSYRLGSALSTTTGSRAFAITTVS